MWMWLLSQYHSHKYWTTSIFPYFKVFGNCISPTRLNTGTTVTRPTPPTSRIHNIHVIHLDLSQPHHLLKEMADLDVNVTVKSHLLSSNDIPITHQLTPVLYFFISRSCRCCARLLKTLHPSRPSRFFNLSGANLQTFFLVGNERWASFPFTLIWLFDVLPSRSVISTSTMLVLLKNELIEKFIRHHQRCDQSLVYSWSKDEFY